MTPAEARRRLQLMQEFRDCLQVYLRIKQDLLNVRAHPDRGYIVSHPGTNQIDVNDAGILARYKEARANVARRIAEATLITDHCGIPSQIKILPPPLLGGYAHTLNIYQATIEEQLAYGFDLPVQKVADVVDQTVFACERLVDQAHEEELRQPSILMKVPGAISKGISAIFRTETDKAILKWTIIILIVTIILKLLGLPVQKIGELIVGWLKK